MAPVRFSYNPIHLFCVHVHFSTIFVINYFGRKTPFEHRAFHVPNLINHMKRSTFESIKSDSACLMWVDP